MATNNKLFGVHWNEKAQKWVTNIDVNGQPHYLGYFDGQQYYPSLFTSKTLAARARDIYILQNDLPDRLNDETLRSCTHDY